MLDFCFVSLSYFVNSSLFNYIIPIFCMFILVFVIGIIRYFVRGSANV